MAVMDANAGVSVFQYKNDNTTGVFYINVLDLICSEIRLCPWLPSITAHFYRRFPQRITHNLNWINCRPKTIYCKCPQSCKLPPWLDRVDSYWRRPMAFSPISLLISLYCSRQSMPVNIAQRRFSQLFCPWGCESCPKNGFRCPQVCVVQFQAWCCSKQRSRQN